MVLGESSPMRSSFAKTSMLRSPPSEHNSGMSRKIKFDGRMPSRSIIDSIIDFNSEFV